MKLPQLPLLRHHFVVSKWKSHAKPCFLFQHCNSHGMGHQIGISTVFQYSQKVAMGWTGDSNGVRQNMTCMHLTWSQCRHISTKQCLYSSKSSQSEPENSVPDLQTLLETDPELRAILKDIEKDFDSVLPPPPSGHSTKTPPKDSYQNKVVHGEEWTKQSNIFGPKGQDQNKLLKPHNDGHDTPTLRSIMDKFKDFRDGDAEVILDSDEQRNLDAVVPSHVESSDQEEFYLYQEKKDKVAEFSVKRGITGVYDVEELVKLLQGEKMRDIAVIQIPPSMRYADYIVLSTALSPRHSKAVVEFIRKLHKRKKNPSDPYLLIEGASTHDWRAIDMGNIVLHVFLEKTRQVYDLETLWTVGEDYDTLVRQKSDPLMDDLERQMQLLQLMQPLQETDDEQVKQQMTVKK